MSTATDAADRLDQLSILIANELQAFRGAVAAPKAQASQNQSLLNLEHAVSEARKTVARFDATIEQLIQNMKSTAQDSAFAIPDVNGRPGPVRNQDHVGAQIMQTALELKNSLLARARSAFQLAQLEQRIAESAPPAIYEPSHEGEPVEAA